MRSQVIRISNGQILCEAKAGPASLSLPVERVANVDRLRVLAAIGIVWFHTDGVPYRQIAYAGLPVFLLIFFSLLTMQGSAGTTMDFLRRRYNRLLKPWLFWSVVYGLCRLTKAMHTMDVGSLREMLSVETLLAGTSIHLWYLPYAFLSSLLIRGFNHWTSRANHTVVVLATTTAGAILLAAHAAGLWDRRLTCPLPQWEFGLAAIPLGIAVGRCLAIASRDQQRLLLTTIALVTGLECYVLSLRSFDACAVPYGIGVTLVCLAYCWEIRRDTIVAWLAPLTFGVYLIHPLVAYVLRHTLAPHEHFVIFVLLTVCISILVVLILMRTPIRRFV